MSEKKFKRQNERDDYFLKIMNQYKYLDFNFINKYIYPTYESRRHLLRKLRTFIDDGLMVNYISERKVYEDIDRVIYAINEVGNEITKDKYDNRKFDVAATKRLKQGYLHHLVVIHILFKAREENEGVLIFNERESYQDINSKRKYTDSSKVIRPDGAILNENGRLIILEYEHSNLRRDLFMKLTRYNDYFEKKLYRFSYSFGEYSKNIELAFLHLVTSKPLTKKAIERIMSLDLKYIITSCTAEEMLNNPMNQNNYKTIEKHYEEIVAVNE